MGLREPGRGPRSSRNSSSSGNCTSSGGGRPGLEPAGREPQEGERAEEGEEEGKEEEEKSSQQARGGRTSWCGGCQQPRKRETEQRVAEQRRDPAVPRGRRLGRPTRPDHRGGSTWRIGGLSLRLPHRPRDTWGFKGRAWAPPRRREFLLFRSANFPRRDALWGKVRPPKRTGQPLIAARASRAAGARRPQRKDSPTS